MSADFAHLHGHSPWSLLDGAAPIEAAMRQALADGQPGIAFTDHGVLHGVVEAYKAARRLSQEAGRPFRYVPGVEAYVAPRSRFDKDHRAGDDANYHMVFWALDDAGLRGLFKLVSRAELYRKPRIDLALVEEVVGAIGQGHLASSTACLGSEWGQAILRGQEARAQERLARWAEVLGPGCFFVELQDHGLAEQQTVNRALLAMARRLGLPLLATNDFHYLQREHAPYQHVLMCVAMNKKVGEGYQQPPEFYLKSRVEMEQLFGELPEALRNTVALVERCQVELPFGRTHLPRFPLPPGFASAGAYLRHLAYEGARRRYPEAAAAGAGAGVSATGGAGAAAGGAGAPAADPQAAEAWARIAHRLDYELGVIEAMGYPDYFLIVADFIAFARSRGIPVGPGRGSSAGSLVAYCLGITNIDPLRYGLLFERFLNPERVTLPDIDVDFCDHRRNEVIEYVMRKYGDDRVAQIITFGTLKPRAAIRDVARALDVPLSKADRAAKAVPPGTKSLAQALEASPELREMVKADPQLQRVVETARFMEGYPRHASIHAAGVIIAPRPLEEEIPLIQLEGKVVTRYATQWPFGVVEELGYVKMDFLALRNLSVIQEAIDWVRRLRGIEIDIDRIPLDDPATFAIFQRGLTGGVFQFESEGMRQLLQEFKPESLEHLTLLNAMYRPGPMQYIPAVIERRHGREEVRYLHPDLADILAETYGIMVYQEDIMNVAQRFAGFTLGQADLLRRAMGKKKPEEMARARAQFVAGAVTRGYSEELANRLFDDMEPFAGYAFCKAHAAAYALVAYQTAWLKAHYPSEYMAALLTSVMGKNKNIKLGQYLEECRHMGVEVLPPDVNTSAVAFEPRADGKIVFGLGAVKNVGEAAVRHLIACRQERPYRSFFDFCARACGPGGLNREAVLSLIRVGAFDAFGARRAQLEAVLDDALRLGGRGRVANQPSFFDLGGDLGEAMGTELPLPDLPEHPPEAKLAAERELVGIYLSGHPLEGYRDRLPALGAVGRRALEDLPPQAPVTVAGVVTEVQKIVTRAGDEMAFLTLEDLEGPIEVVVFPRLYRTVRDLLVPGALLVARGKNDSGREEGRLTGRASGSGATGGAGEGLGEGVSEGTGDPDLDDPASLEEDEPGVAEEAFVAKVIADRLERLAALLEEGGRRPVAPRATAPSAASRSAQTSREAPADRPPPTAKPTAADKPAPTGKQPAADKPAPSGGRALLIAVRPDQVQRLESLRVLLLQFRGRLPVAVHTPGRSSGCLLPEPFWVDAQRLEALVTALSEVLGSGCVRLGRWAEEAPRRKAAHG